MKVQNISGLNFSNINWKLIITGIVVCFYLVFFGPSLLDGTFYSSTGVDYVAYWSVGKIADEVGYSKIYDLNFLRSYQEKAEEFQADSANATHALFAPVPVPYFAFFVLPFQLLSRLPLITGFWTWTLLNVIILICYLIFFTQKINPPDRQFSENLPQIILLLFSWAIIMNMKCGQVEVFLLVCTGEFLRNAIKNQPILSGFWLGGLLLKPQLLILIIPIILIKHARGVLQGFLASSVTILIVSLLLSGFSGLKALFDLLTKYSGGMATNAPEAMINWRMAGVVLNSFLNTSFGWLLTFIGTTLTLLAVNQLIKKRPVFGSSQWVMNMLGVFSATLAVTWHSHYHMAMVLIPLLLYTTVNKVLPERYLFLWVSVIPITLHVAVSMIEYVPLIEKVYLDNYLSINALAGLTVNLVILNYSIKYLHLTTINNSI